MTALITSTSFVNLLLKIVVPLKKTLLKGRHQQENSPLSPQFGQLGPLFSDVKNDVYDRKSSMMIMMVTMIIMMVILMIMVTKITKNKLV